MIKPNHVVDFVWKDYNKLNDVIKNELEFDSVSILSIDPNNAPQPVVTVIIRGGTTYRLTVVSGVTCL